MPGLLNINTGTHKSVMIIWIKMSKKNGLLYGYGTTFEEFIRGKKQMGEPIIIKLLAPPKPINRLVRKVK